MITCIIGTNCSGKTSLVKYLLGDSYEVIQHEKYKATKGNGYVAFGPYYPEKKMGGADCSGSGDGVIANLKSFLADYPNDDCLIEGFLVPTRLNIGRFREAHGNRIIPIFLNTDIETTLRRLEQRNGVKKEYKNGGANIIGKAKSCLSLYRFCVAEELPAKLIDTTDLTFDDTAKVVKDHIAATKESWADVTN